MKHSQEKAKLYGFIILVMDYNWMAFISLYLLKTCLKNAGGGVDGGILIVEGWRPAMSFQ